MDGAVGGGRWLVMSLGGVVIGTMGCVNGGGCWLCGFVVAWVVRITKNKKR